MGFSVYWMLAVLGHVVECPSLPIPCALPEKDAKHVNFDYCDGSRIVEYIEHSTNAESFSCKLCNLTDIPAKAFENHEKLKEVDFSANIHLHIPMTECFLESKYIERLKISNITDLPVLTPKVVECMPNLRELTISGLNCTKSKQSLETILNKLRVKCASDIIAHPTSASSSTAAVIPNETSSQKTDNEDPSIPKIHVPSTKPDGNSQFMIILWSAVFIVFIFFGTVLFCIWIRNYNIINSIL